MIQDLLCLALDVDTVKDATGWIERTRDRIGTYKLGLQAFCANGPAIVTAAREAGARRIFLDLKLHDIPHTVASATARIADLGVDLLTLHAAGGPAMIEAAVRAAEGTDLNLLAVTVLTSLTESDHRRTGVGADLPEIVALRARLALEHGVAGLVCSPHEARALRARHGPRPRLVTPGIRLDGPSHDQARIADPRRAREWGADLLVIGRAITAAPDPLAALADLHRMLQ